MRERKPTETSKQPIRPRYLGHVTDYQPIRDQYFLVYYHNIPLKMSFCWERGTCVTFSISMASSSVVGEGHSPKEMRCFRVPWDTVTLYILPSFPQHKPGPILVMSC
eukprot:sb/3477675/